MKVSMFISLLVFSVASSAADSDSLVQLRLDLEILKDRVDALERENESLRRDAITRIPKSDQTGPITITDAIASSAKTSLDGDFRLRYESIDLEGSEVHERARIRARANLARRIGQNTVVGVGLATGGDSPTSSTQTLGNGGSKKSVALDLAYVDWQPVEDLHVLAGKFKNHLFKVPSQTLLWDDEWRPEGIGVSFDNKSYFVSLLGTWLESDSLAADREFAAGAQAGIHRSLGIARVTAGVGYFDFGVSNFGTYYGSDLNFAGNTFECTEPLDTSSCVYTNDYREVELFAGTEFDKKNYSASIYAHYLRNIAADQFNEGWTIGSRVRFNARTHPMQLHYFYRHLEADAVFAQLTDSDFGGGGTDAKGHYFKVGWSASPSLVLSVTYFDNDVGANQADQSQYKRVQLNADFSY